MSEMVKDVYLVTNDKAWLDGALSSIEKEYRFYTEKRWFSLEKY